MKRSLMFATLLLALALFAGSAFAAEEGGFKGPSIGLSTVEQAKNMKDDAPIALRGNIVRHLGKDNYEFKDATGTITVEIDNDKWGGVTVQPSDIVEIHGEVDREFSGTKIDVDKVVKVQ